MKHYKLLKDLPTFKAGQTFYINQKGNLCADNIKDYPELVAYSANTLERFPNILTDWFEEIEEDSDIWEPKGGERCYMMILDGNSTSVIWENDDYDKAHLALGNCFKTREECERTVAKLKAYHTLKRDAKGFVPDWNDSGQMKWEISYNYVLKLVDIYSSTLRDIGAIYFRTKEDAERSLETHRSEWETLFDFDLEDKINE